MKPIDLYDRIPEKIEKNLGVLKGCEYNHIPELYYADKLCKLDNKDIDIKYYKDYSFDGRRVWKLASVWYKDKPVMIIQNAGNEGDDHSKRFITNESLFKDMLEYIGILLENDSRKPASDIVDENTDIETLANFYDNILEGKFILPAYAC